MRTAKEVLEEKDLVQEQYNSIKSQIEFAEARQSFYADDPTWLPRAKAALRAKGSLILRLCGELGQIRSAGKQENISKSLSNSQNFSKRFMRNAKLLLPEDTYIMLLSVSQEGSNE